MSWVLAATLLAASLFVGLGFAAFWPEYPPIEPGVHRSTPTAPEPEGVEGARNAEESERRRPRHRNEDLKWDTQPLRWYEVPRTSERPLHPES